jgi:hypothetical protein
MNCPYCGSSFVKSSRLRISDFPEPLIGRFPMRCRDCVGRFFVWFPQVLVSMCMQELDSRINPELHKNSRT